MAEDIDGFDHERYSEELYRTMLGIPKPACVAVAARAAWRAVPLMFQRWITDEKKDEWWAKHRNSVQAKLALVACYEKHRSTMSKWAAAAAAGEDGSYTAGYALYAAQAAAEAGQGVVAGSVSAAYATRAFAKLGDPKGVELVKASITFDLRYSLETGQGLMALPLWPESTPHDWLVDWTERARMAMTSTPGAETIYGWLLLWMKGRPPIDSMKVWFNDWWLKHPMNIGETPAFSDMPVKVSSDYTPTTVPEPTPYSIPTSEPPEQINIRRHLESTVALASDREAKQLTPTAERCKEALARFLASNETQTPLTVSVEAPWGAGKTSFMSHLRKRLEAEKIPTVWFNPWKHEAGKTMWAAFALEYERQMARQLWWPRRVCCRVLLNFRRMGWAGFTLLLLRLGLWTGVGVLLWLVAPQVKAALDSVLKQAGEDSAFRDWLIKWLPLVGPAWIILKDVIKITGIPLKRESMQGLNGDPHAESVDDLHRFHEDFTRLMRAYHPANGWWARLFYRQRLLRVVVFIDDLDRCEAPKAADVLQSLHLMLNVTESAGQRMPEMICVLGMDRKKVAAAVAAKHEKLLPMLVAEDEKGTVPPARALAFGNQFLEKFIQLTLHLPGMMGEDRVHYLREITGLDARLKSAAPKSTSAKTMPSLAVAVDPPVGTLVSMVGPSFPLYPSEPKETPEVMEKKAVQARVRNVDEHLHDGQTAFDCASYVADALENNPRRLKQFVNLLRLRLLLAAAMDLLDADTLSADVLVVKEGKLSAHQLAKLVALDLMCPQSMAKMRGNPGIWYSTLADLAKAENAERSDAITVMLNHGRRLNPDPLRNLYVLDGAPLEAYFQQLATVAPALMTGPVNAEDIIEDMELAERRGRAGLK